MGQCPSCGVVLSSTAEAAAELGVTGSRVRGLLADRPGRLRGRRAGWLWIVPAEGVGQFSRQPTGVHLPPGVDGHRLEPSTCPGCGERLLSPSEAAGEIGVSRSRVHAILARRPQRLRAFRVGCRWVIPGSGAEAYRARRRLLQDLDGTGEYGRVPPAVEDAEPDGEGVRVQVEMVVTPCRCPAYHFPHRPGGGRCEQPVASERDADP